MGTIRFLDGRERLRRRIATSALLEAFNCLGAFGRITVLVKEPQALFCAWQTGSYPVVVRAHQVLHVSWQARERSVGYGRFRDTWYPFWISKLWQAGFDMWLIGL